MIRYKLCTLLLLLAILPPLLAFVWWNYSEPQAFDYAAEVARQAAASRVRGDDGVWRPMQP